MIKLSNCPQKWKLDTLGCNALPLSPRVQSGRRRGCRRRPGFFLPSLILPFDLTICTSWLNWFDPSWPFDHVRQHWMQNLLKSDESKQVWHRLGSWILLVTALVVESDFPDIRLSLCVCRVLTYNCNNESDAFTTFQLISAPRRHTGNSPPDGPGTILLIKFDLTAWQVFQVPSLMWCPGPGKVEAGSEAEDWGAGHRPDLFQPWQQVILLKCTSLILIIS